MFVVSFERKPMTNSITGVTFFPDDLAALIAWSEEAKAQRLASEIAGDGSEHVPENLLVTLPGADQPAFSLWTLSNGAYCLEDWRRLGWDDAGVSSSHPTLEAALHQIESEAAQYGKALPRLAV